MKGSIDNTIRAALLLNANNLLAEALETDVESLRLRWEQSADTYIGLYHEYNTVDVWSDPQKAWDLGKWTQVVTALRVMSDKEAEPYKKDDTLRHIEYWVETRVPTKED